MRAIVCTNFAAIDSIDAGDTTRDLPEANNRTDPNRTTQHNQHPFSLVTSLSAFDLFLLFVRGRWWQQRVDR